MWTMNHQRTKTRRTTMKINVAKAAQTGDQVIPDTSEPPIDVGEELVSGLTPVPTSTSPMTLHRLRFGRTPPYVDCRINVTAKRIPARFAGELAQLQWHLLPMPARGARLGSVGSGNFHKLTTSICSFVREHLRELSPP